MGILFISDRLFWDSFDPHNLAEGMFAVANVISFTRLSYVLPANELFGPMQISLAKMISVSIVRQNNQLASIHNWFHFDISDFSI